MKTLSRRNFLKLSSSAGAAAAGLSLLPAQRAGAIEPFKHAGPARLRLSMCAYSFREFMNDSTRKQKSESPAGKRIDMFQFVDYCAEHGCDGAELTSYYFPKDTDDDFLKKLKRHCYLRGVALSGTSVGTHFTLPEGE